MRTPLFDTVQAFSRRDKVPFYMPGHKGRPMPDGSGLPLASWDVTELPGTDSLFCPEGVIAEAQELAAEAFGAAHTFFLVGGSSCGVLAMLLYALSGGQSVICDRNCHASAVHGLMLCGARPVFIAPEMTRLGIPGGITPAALEEAFAASPDAKAVLVTYPNYYGLCCDLPALCRVAHSHGALVLVDEAHGAHLPFGSALPPPALSCGADLSVTSMHKMLPAPNQSALLHCAESIDAARLKQCVNVFQTTSPSYPIMAAMDLARAKAAELGRAWTAALLERLRPARRYDACLDLPEAGVTARDPFKLILAGGHAFGNALFERGVYAELSDRFNTLLLCSWNTTGEDVTRLIKALESLPRQRREDVPPVPMERVAVPAMTPAQTWEAAGEAIPFESCAGAVSKHAVTAFPPCIPILLPGEKITAGRLEALAALKEAGAVIQGIHSGKIEIIRPS